MPPGVPYLIAFVVLVFLKLVSTRHPRRERKVKMGKNFFCGLLTSMTETVWAVGAGILGGAFPSILQVMFKPCLSARHSLAG